MSQLPTTTQEPDQSAIDALPQEFQDAAAAAGISDEPTTPAPETTPNTATGDDHPAEATKPVGDDHPADEGQEATGLTWQQEMTLASSKGVPVKGRTRADVQRDLIAHLHGQDAKPAAPSDLDQLRSDARDTYGLTDEQLGRFETVEDLERSLSLFEGAPQAAPQQQQTQTQTPSQQKQPSFWDPEPADPSQQPAGEQATGMLKQLDEQIAATEEEFGEASAAPLKTMRAMVHQMGQQFVQQAQAQQNAQDTQLWNHVQGLIDSIGDTELFGQTAQAATPKNGEQRDRLIHELTFLSDRAQRGGQSGDYTPAMVRLAYRRAFASEIDKRKSAERDELVLAGNGQQLASHGRKTPAQDWTGEMRDDPSLHASFYELQKQGA